MQNSYMTADNYSFPLSIVPLSGVAQYRMNKGDSGEAGRKGRKMHKLRFIRFPEHNFKIAIRCRKQNELDLKMINAFLPFHIWF